MIDWKSVLSPFSFQAVEITCIKVRSDCSELFLSRMSCFISVAMDFSELVTEANGSRSVTTSQLNEHRQ